jgi:hypothetical protein
MSGKCSADRQKRHTCRLTVGNSEGKRHSENPAGRQNNNIKIHTREIMGERGSIDC